jgi:hypothetical protein
MNRKEKNGKKYANDLKYKKKLERQAKEIEYWPGPAYWVDEKWVKDEGYVPLEKPYVKKVYKSSHAQRYRYYKNYSNRKIRRHGLLPIPRGCGYKKVFDYAYTVD